MTDVLLATPQGIARAAAFLAGGGLVAFPTDTVYGVACATTHPEAVAALFALKRRPPERRIPMLVTGIEQVDAAGYRADERARALAARWWPGPLTLVLPPAGASGDTQAFRVPDHPVALALIHEAGPLFATSANISGEPDTLDADDVLIAFATQREGLAAVLDGGPVPGGVASSVVDLSVTPAQVLREGPVVSAEIAELVGLRSPADD